MSTDQIISNPILLQELATALAPDFPDTGITSLVGDSNITCSTVGRVGHVNLDPNITVNNLVVTTSDAYANINIISTHAGGNSWGFYNNANGSSFPNELNIYNNTLGQVAISMANADNKVTINNVLNLKSALQLNGSAGTTGQVLTSAGAGTLPTWSSGSGGGFTLLSRPTLTFIQSGGDSSTCTVTGDLYQSGKIIYFAGDDASGNLTISGTGLISLSGTSPFSTVPPKGTFQIPIVINDNTSLYSITGMWNMTTVSGNVLIQPLGSADFTNGHQIAISQMSLMWTTP